MPSFNGYINHYQRVRQTLWSKSQRPTEYPLEVSLGNKILRRKTTIFFQGRYFHSPLGTSQKSRFADRLTTTSSHPSSGFSISISFSPTDSCSLYHTISNIHIDICIYIYTCIFWLGETVKSNFYHDTRWFKEKLPIHMDEL